MNTIGRIISRGNVAGLFIPIQGGLPPGVYSLTECMGEYLVRYEGPPVMEEGRFMGLSLDHLFDERGSTGITPTELASIRKEAPCITDA